MTDFAKTKSMFNLPDGVIYLDGNSLGPQPKDVPNQISKMVTDEWGEMLISGWNNFSDNTLVTVTSGDFVTNNNFTHFGN